MTTVLNNQSFEERYKPRSLNDVVFPDIIAEQKIKAYLSGQKRRPLLLYGPPGTGKTSVAKLLPDAMCPDFTAANLLEIGGYDAASSAEVVSKIQGFCKRAPLGNCPFTVIFLDEIDMLPPGARGKLKALIDNAGEWVFFMFTTNHHSVLETPLKSRCTKVHFDKADPHRWLPRMKQILKRERVIAPPDPHLLNLAELADGDVREILDELQDLVITLRAQGKTLKRKISA